MLTMTSFNWWLNWLRTFRYKLYVFFITVTDRKVDRQTYRQTTTSTELTPRADQWNVFMCVCTIITDATFKKLRLPGVGRTMSKVGQTVNPTGTFVGKKIAPTGSLFWRGSRVGMIAVWPIVGINSVFGPGIDSSHGSDRPLMNYN